MKRILLACGVFSTVAYAALFVSTKKSFAEELQHQSRGVVQSAKRIELRSDLSALVTSAKFSEGRSFKKGDVLVSFDCKRHQAELNSAKAAARGASLERKNKTTLYNKGAAGRNEVLLAKASAEKAQHDVTALRERMKNCSITAPFDGRIVALNVRRMEMPPGDKPLMIIIDDSALELELVVPSKWLSWLSRDEEFRFRVEETGAEHNATIERIGAEVDTVSQTIKVYGKLLGDMKNTLSGMSGVALFDGTGT